MGLRHGAWHTTPRRAQRGAGDSSDRLLVSRAGTLAGAVVLVLVLAACGKTGPPIPPVSRGPLPPRAPRARQLGTSLLVAFDVPAARGSRPGQELVAAELVRVAFPGGIVPPQDPEVFRRRGQVVGRHAAAGPLVAGSRLELADEDTATLGARGVGAVLRYAVRVIDRGGRRSPLVVVRDLTPIESVPAPTGLTAEPTKDGVRLSWRPPPGLDEASFNIYRIPTGGRAAETPINAKPVYGPAFLDASAIPGESYDYSVRVALHPEPPFREGEPANLVDVLVDDRFSPAPPAGLVGVQEGLAVRLFWDPSPEYDVAGYRVARRVGDGEWTGAGADLVREPLFLDRDVEIGQRIDYRVTAVDRADPPNESGPSDPVEVWVVEEPVAGGPDVP